MSDYLNNIVARSLSVADVVQPRVPHLFEQAPAAMSAETEPASAGESVMQTMVESGEAPQIVYSPSPVEQMNPTVAAPVFEQFHPESSSPIALPATPLLPEPATTMLEAKQSTAPPAPNKPAIHVKSAPTQQQRPLNQNATRVAETVVPSRVGPSQSEPQATVRTGNAVTRRSNAPISPGAPAALPQVNRAEPQLPPIRISIGRVDVRAIMPAAPAKAAASPRPRPAMSLENYLKQREEGKR